LGDISIGLLGKQYFLVSSDQLDQFLVEHSPEFRRDTERLADLIKEMVDLEREERGLAIVGGKGTLELNQKRKANPSAPDFVGRILISGKTYQVSAYVGHNQQFINLIFSKPDPLR
jgi:hypothetical protein